MMGHMQFIGFFFTDKSTLRLSYVMYNTLTGLSQLVLFFYSNELFHWYGHKIRLA